jgi:DNA-binding MarR family transcriptional regulator
MSDPMVNIGKKNLSRSDFRKHAEFRYWVRRFLSASETNARKLGMGSSQYQLLLAVKGLPPGEQPNISTMAERLMVESHSVVELADRCVKGGFLERFREGPDQRMVFVRLTELGNEAVEKIALQNRDEIMDALPALMEFLKALV